MIKVVGVRFRQAGKIYYFDPADFDLELSMHVIVETARGVEMGTVLIPPKEVEEDKVIQPLKPVIRVATDEDERVVERNREREKEAFAICKEKILKHELDMKLVGAEYTFDNNKLLFYFTADGRVDFRDLVKDLAAVFRTRIELRQIGVRDETKIMGGVGICGRPLCCATYLSDFVPVSIKMAKEQNLSLNPTKISGVCGRLMCCLKNEEDTYEYLNSRMPSVGDSVTTPDGKRGEVTGVNVLRQLVKVVVDVGDEKELREYSVDDVHFKSRRRKDVKLTEEELQQLKELETLEADEADAEGGEERRSDRGERNNRKERRDRGDKQNRPNREERSNSDNRASREERPNREERPRRDHRPERSENAEGDDRSNSGEQPERREGGEGNRNRNRRRRGHHSGNRGNNGGYAEERRSDGE